MGDSARSFYKSMTTAACGGATLDGIKIAHVHCSPPTQTDFPLAGGVDSAAGGVDGGDHVVEFRGVVRDHVQHRAEDLARELREIAQFVRARREERAVRVLRNDGT